MLVPLFGLVIASTLFAGLAAVALPLAGLRPVRVWMLAVFIVSANVAGLAYSGLYGLLLADANNQLGSISAVLGLLLGIPVAGALVGVAAVRLLARRFG